MDPSHIQTHVYQWSGFWPAITFGSFVIPTYFLMTSVAFVVALVFLARRADRLRVARNRALDAALILMVSGFFGSRLFHVFFEEPAYYFADPMRVFDIWRGGFVWYGGAIAGALCTLGYLKYRRENVARFLDLFAPVAALGYAIGRTACLFTGCCFGEISHLGAYTFRQPTQIYAIVLELCTLGILIRLETQRSKHTWLKTDGQLFCVWLIMHGIGRIVMEIFRADPRGPEPLGVSISTWLSGVLILIAAYILNKHTKFKNPKP